MPRIEPTELHLESFPDDLCWPPGYVEDLEHEPGAGIVLALPWALVMWGIVIDLILWLTH